MFSLCYICSISCSTRLFTADTHWLRLCTCDCGVLGPIPCIFLSFIFFTSKYFKNYQESCIEICSTCNVHSDLYHFVAWVVKQSVKITLNNSFAWMYLMRAYQFMEQCVHKSTSSWIYNFQQHIQGFLFKGEGFVSLIGHWKQLTLYCVGCSESILQPKIRK
jgi:hypothetical protein